MILERFSNDYALAASLGWQSSQELLSAGAPLFASQRDLSAGWHGRGFDDHAGAFALVKQGGSNSDLVGDRLRVQTGERTIYVYVYAEAVIAEDISLTRRAFAALVPLATDSLDVQVMQVAGVLG